MIRYIALGTLLVFGASVAAAQESRGRIGFGPQLGLYKATDADNMRVMGGIALRMKLADALGVEGSINYREEEYSDGAITVRSWPVMVTGLLYPIPDLYGAVGAGWYNTSIDYDFPKSISPLVTVQSETKQRFGWHFGGGLELPLGTVGKLVGDVRWVFLDYDFQQFPGSNGVKNDFYVITVGLMFGL
jgi:opacity protein-like surface antigen